MCVLAGTIGNYLRVTGKLTLIDIIQDVEGLMRDRNIYTREVYIFARVLTGILKLETEAVPAECWTVIEPVRLTEGNGKHEPN